MRIRPRVTFLNPIISFNSLVFFNYRNARDSHYSWPDAMDDEGIIKHVQYYYYYELIDSWVMNMMVSWYKPKHTQHIGTYCIYKSVHCILYLYLEGRTSVVCTLKNGILFPGDQHKAAYCSCRPAPYSNKERTVRATCIPCDRSQPPRSKCKMQDSLLSFSALELKLNNKLN